MKTALEILRTFKRQSVSPVVRTPFVHPSRWVCNSQYGYPLFVRWNRKDALRAVIAYYADKMHLIRQ